MPMQFAGRADLLSRGRGLDGLIGEPHEIFVTAAPGDRAKQILADLISGPNDRTGD